MRQRTDQDEFWKFTDEEMEKAKNTDLPDLLEHLGYHLKRVGSYYTTREMDSIRIKNRRTWKRYSSGKGGDGTSFKRDVLGSDKSVAFPIPCNPDIPWVLVFEAPIDLMSFCTLHREAMSNAIALCGLYEGGLNRYLKDHPHLNHVVLCLDNDGPGREAAERLRAEYEGRGLRVSTRTPAKGKDWNECAATRCCK